MPESTHTDLLRDAIFAAIQTLIEAVGVDEPDLEVRIPGAIDRDQVPAIAFHAARNAIKFLAVGHGTLDAAPREQLDDADVSALLDPKRRERGGRA